MNHLSFLKFATASVAILCVFIATSSWAGTRDTVADVQESAREGIADTADVKAAIDDINAFLAQLNTDANYRKNFLDAASKSDQTTILSLVRQRATRTKVAVTRLSALNSFLIRIGFQTSKGRDFGVCFSTDATQRCPNGKGFQVGEFK